jgi:hypothetical protein
LLSPCKSSSRARSTLKPSRKVKNFLKINPKILGFPSFVFDYSKKYPKELRRSISPWLYQGKLSSTLMKN